MRLLNNHKNYIYIFIILVIALAIRLVGINYGLPNNNFHSDEPKMVLPATHVAVSFVNTKNFLKLEQPEYKYPHGVMNIFSVGYIVIYYATRVVDKIYNISPMIFSTFDNSTFTSFARIIVAVFGSLLCLVIYLIGKEIKLNKFISFCWALMVAVNFGLSVHSKYATRNIISVFLAYLGLYYLFKFVNIKKLLYLIIGSFFIGFAIVSSLERAFFILPIIIAIYLVSQKDLVKFFKLGLVSLLFVCIAMFTTSPYIFLNFNRFMENGLGGQLETQSFGQIGRTALNPLYIFLNNNNVDFDQKVPNSIAGNLTLLVFVVSLIGIYYKLLKKRDKYDLMLLSILTFQLLVFSRYRSQMIRWYVGLFPIFLYYFIFFTLSIRSKFKYLLISIFLIGFLLNLFYSIEFSYTKTLPDTRVLAKNWMNSNLEKETIVYSTYWSANGDFKGAGIPFYYYEQKHNIHNTFAPNFKSFFCQGKLHKYQYVVVSSYVTKIYNYKESLKYYPNHSKSFIKFYNLIDKNFHLVKVISGDKLFKNSGPTLKIYKVLPSKLNCEKKVNKN